MKTLALLLVAVVLVVTDVASTSIADGCLFNGRGCKTSSVSGPGPLFQALLDVVGY